MISKLSEQLAEKMLSSGTTSDEDKELYVYAFFMLLSQLIFFVIACLFGVILNCILESILFYLAFQFIRKYAGGYHAKTETRCEIMSTFTILACIIIIRLAETYDLQTILLIISTVSTACIFVFCPLDTPENPLSEKEFKYFRKISWLILSVITTGIIVSFIINVKMILVPSCLSLILEGILIVAGKIKKLHTEIMLKDYLLDTLLQEK